MSFAPRESAFTISGSERSSAFVIPPAADWILIPAASTSSTSRFSTNINWLGGVVLVPFAKAKYEYPAPPAAVVTVKLGSVAVFRRVNAISRPSVASIVFPVLYAA